MDTVNPNKRGLARVNRLRDVSRSRRGPGLIDFAKTATERSIHQGLLLRAGAPLRFAKGRRDVGIQRKCGTHDPSGSMMMSDRQNCDAHASQKIETRFARFLRGAGPGAVVAGATVGVWDTQDPGTQSAGAKSILRRNLEYSARELGRLHRRGDQCQLKRLPIGTDLELPPRRQSESRKSSLGAQLCVPRPQTPDP